MSIKHTDDLLNKDELFNKGKVTVTCLEYYGGKKITVLTGLPIDIDLTLILSYLIKINKCDGYLYTDNKMREMLVLIGYHKDNINMFLLKEELCRRHEIIFKGL
jgi:translation initiation factor 1 (eIF-1/SUI1)